MNKHTTCMIHLEVARSRKQEQVLLKLRPVKDSLAFLCGFGTLHHLKMLLSCLKRSSRNAENLPPRRTSPERKHGRTLGIKLQAVYQNA